MNNRILGCLPRNKLLEKIFKKSKGNNVVDEAKQVFEVSKTDFTKIDNKQSLIEAFEETCIVNGKRRAIGKITTSATDDSQTTSISYLELLASAKTVGAALNKKFPVGAKIGIYSTDAYYHLIMLFASLFCRFVVVLIPSESDEDELIDFLKKTKPTALICSPSDISYLSEFSKKLSRKCQFLGNILASPKSDTRKLEKHFNIMHYDSLVKEGSELYSNGNPLFQRPSGSDDIFIAFSHKKRIITHTNLSIINSINTLTESMKCNNEDVYLSVLPLTSICGFSAFGSVFSHGGYTVFGDVDDMVEVDPTIFIGTGDMYEEIKKETISYLKRDGSYKKFNELSGERENSNIFGKGESFHVTKGIQKIYECLFGEELRYAMVVNDISNDASAFFSSLLREIPFVQGINVNDYLSGGFCGYKLAYRNGVRCNGYKILSHIEHKIIDVPHMGYYRKNNVGELLLKGNILKENCDTEHLYINCENNERWYRTGKVVNRCDKDHYKIVCSVSRPLIEIKTMKNLEELYEKCKYTNNISLFKAPKRCSGVFGVCMIDLKECVGIEKCNINMKSKGIRKNFEQVFGERIISKYLENAVLKSLKKIHQENDLRECWDVKAVLLVAKEKKCQVKKSNILNLNKKEIFELFHDLKV